MKTLFNTLILFMVLVLGSNAQTDPYQSVNQAVGQNAQEPEVLWPFEMEGVTMEGMTIKYEAPFAEVGSNITFDFNEFQLVKSSVYDLSKIERSVLIQGFEDGLSSDFTTDFKKVNQQNFCLMSTKEVKGTPSEVYLLVGNGESAELLFFEYGENATDLHEKISIELSKVLN